jgi:integrase
MRANTYRTAPFTTLFTTVSCGGFIKEGPRADCRNTMRDDALVRLGLSVGLRVSEVVGIRTSEVDFDRGLIKTWDEKKGRWRLIMPTNEALGAIRKYLKSLDKQPKTLFPISAKTVERLIQGYSKRALGFTISWHSLRTSYVSRSVELEQSPSVVMANTGDSPATILKYNAKLPQVVMRLPAENKPVIPANKIQHLCQYIV